MSTREKIKNKVLEAYGEGKPVMILLRHTKDCYTGEIEEVNLEQGYVKLKGIPPIYFGQIENIVVIEKKTSKKIETGKLTKTMLGSGV
jgi:hypothetical protein